MFLIKMDTFGAALALALTLAGAGCLEQDFEDMDDDGLVEAGELEDELPPPEEEALGDKDQYKNWTTTTSEEYPPLTCDTQNLVNGVDCTGAYCDNVSLNCEGTSPSVIFEDRFWLGYFSEEGNNRRECPAGSWMTGIACRGAYCDNIAIECTHVTNRTDNNCSWTSDYSEEQPPFDLPAGTFVRGVECKGAYCDLKSYYRCDLI